MASAILHFGNDHCAALPVLTDAGYSVELVSSLGRLRARLDGGDEPDAVSMTDEIGPENQRAISLVRSATFASLILLRNTDRDSFPDVDSDPAEAEFDVIVPRRSPAPELLRDISDAIEEACFIRALSRSFKEQCTEVREGSAQTRMLSRWLRDDSARLREKSVRLRAESARLREESAKLTEEYLSAARLLHAEREILGLSSSIGSGDREVECVACRASFVFPAGEQLFFREKGLQLPTHCPRCRSMKQHVFTLTRVICARCGASTMVPFRPTQDRPVYCRACFKSGYL
jgi:CxxC-x17-CxxC domain-containing protein